MEEILARHRKEIKELRAQLTMLKKAASNNKQMKKDYLVESCKLEKQLQDAHFAELLPFQSSDSSVGELVDLSESDPAESHVKVNRQHARKQRKQEENERIKDEARQQAKLMPNHSQIEQHEISIILNDLQLRIHEVYIYWWYFSV